MCVKTRTVNKKCLILLRCVPSGEIFVKSGKDFWIACKKSDLREVYVIVCQKNANLTFIDGNFDFTIETSKFKLFCIFFSNLTEEVKQLCSTNFSNIFFME